MINLGLFPRCFVNRAPGSVWSGWLSLTYRRADRGVSDGVRSQLQRGSDRHAAVRLVLLAGSLRSLHVPHQRHLHGVLVERRAQQGHVVGDRSHPQEPGPVGRLETHATRLDLDSDDCCYLLRTAGRLSINWAAQLVAENQKVWQ